MFAEVVREHRARLGWTQEELADRTSVAVRTLREIETGRVSRPRAGTVRLLAAAFGLAGADLAEFLAAARGDRNGAAARPPPPAPRRRPSPAQLPADLPGFTGRAEELRQLGALLPDAESAARTVVISAVSGTAGVGKTALAVHWAHRAADRFPDGQLYVNLRGFDPGGRVTDPAEAVRGFLDALGVPVEQIPAGADAQVGLYRSLLAGKRMLILLDNARDAEQARPLLPGSPGCLALVTSRNQLTSLVAANGAQPVTLDVLTAGEARELLTARLGAARVAAEPAAVEEIIARCARLPLALTIAAARVQQTGGPLDDLAAELADERGRLDALSAGDAASEMRAVFSWSYTALPAPAARVFRLLGLHPGPDVSAAAVASLAGRPAAAARPLLAELRRASLVIEPAPGRYTFHDLLRTFATELVGEVDGSAEQRAAVGRLLDHYTHTAHAADRLLYPHRDPIRLALTPPAAGAVAEPPADQHAATAWLAAEHPALVAACHLASAAGHDTHAWQLAWTLDGFCYRQGHWHDLADVWRTGLAAADRLGDPAARAYAHRRLAHAEARLGRFGDAHAHLHRALELSTGAGDEAGQATCHIDLAHLSWRQGRPDRAVEHAAQALARFRVAGHRRGQADALNAVGWYRTQLGDHAQALACCEHALALHQELGNHYGEAGTWDSLGYAHHHLGHFTQAAECYQHALDLYRDLGDRYWQATVRTHLGDTHQAAGRPAAARAAWKDALAMLDDLGHPDADPVRAKLDGVPTRAPA